MQKIKKTVQNEEGAIDLASIMVGIIVIGLIGGVIAATVFAVIPWAQDNAAKEQLKSISQAQNVHAGFTSEPTSASGSITTVGRNSIFIPTELPVGLTYGTLAELKAGGLYSPDSDIAASGIYSVDLSMCASLITDGRDYTAAVVSKSGKTFVAKTSTSPIEVGVEGDETCLGTILSDGKPEIRPEGDTIEEGENNDGNEDNGSGDEDTSVWTVADDTLRSQLTSTLGVEGELTIADAKRLTNDDVANNLWFGSVKTLAGLEKATNVTRIGDLFIPELEDTRGFDNIEHIQYLDFSSVKLATLDSGFDSVKTIGTLTSDHWDETSLTSLTAFSRVEHIDTLRVSGLTSLETVDFSGLKTVGFGGIKFTENGNLTSFGDSFKNLTSVSGVITFSSLWNLTSLAFPELEKVTSWVEFRDLGAITEISFGKLSSIGQPGVNSGITVTDNSYLATLSGLENLERVDYIRINNNPDLTNVSSFSKVTEVKQVKIVSYEWKDGKMVPFDTMVDGDVVIENNNDLTSVSFPNLETVEGNFLVVTDGTTYSAVQDYLNR